MKAAARMLEIASAHPREALQDVIGLSVACALVFIGFAATSVV